MADGETPAQLFQEISNLFRAHSSIDEQILALGTNAPKAFSLSEQQIQSIHRTIMDGLLPIPGAYRTSGVGIRNSRHIPPPHVEVARHMEDLCSYVNDNWEGRDLVHLAAFCMWRLNWIHPFPNGNGRTSRAVAHLVLNAKAGHLLPGSPKVVEQISQHKEPYYECLGAADKVYKETNNYDVTQLESYLSALLQQQLRNALG